MPQNLPLRKRSKYALAQLKPLLDTINNEVEQPGYIEHDPVQFMHAFSDKKDREIAGFLAATMAWGRRDIVVAKVDDLLQRMDYAPFDFVSRYNSGHFQRLNGFKHRTFKPIDIHGILVALQQIYNRTEDLEAFFRQCYIDGRKQNRPFLGIFHHRFLSLTPELVPRTRKHISNPENGSPCKRLFMFLRWTIRRNSPVDPGIWTFMPPSKLMIPLDVHVARQGRKFGLLTRRTNDWKSVRQLTQTLRLMNPDDPTRYDYALFGIGALEYSLPVRYHLNRV